MINLTKYLPFFIVIPILELFVIILLGKTIGFIYTLIIICSTSLLGIFLVKNQGWQSIAKIRSSLSQGQIPGNEVLEGLLILIGGIFLITPGLITDFLGLLLLLPWSRRVIRKLLKIRMYKWLFKGKIKKVIF